MKYEELLEKYKLLLAENSRLTEENDRLKARLGITEFRPSTHLDKIIPAENTILDDESTECASFQKINNSSDTILKIKLFMSLFRGRDDVYAKRWENKKKAASGYSPVCLNQWKVGLCEKPKISCTKCSNKLYGALDEHVIEDHLRGNIIAGIYPLLPEETCYFLAMDFDEKHWQKDISTVREVCTEFNIPVAVERLHALSAMAPTAAVRHGTAPGQSVPWPDPVAASAAGRGRASPLPEQPPQTSAPRARRVEAQKWSTSTGQG